MCFDFYTYEFNWRENQDVDIKVKAFFNRMDKKTSGTIDPLSRECHHFNWLYTYNCDPTYHTDYVYNITHVYNVKVQYETNINNATQGDKK